MLLSPGKFWNNLAVRSLLSFVLRLNRIIPKSSSIDQFHPIPPSLVTSRFIPPRKRLALLHLSRLTLLCFFSPIFPSASQFVGPLTTPPLFLCLHRRSPDIIHLTHSHYTKAVFALNPLFLMLGANIDVALVTLSPLLLLCLHSSLAP